MSLEKKVNSTRKLFLLLSGLLCLGFFVAFIMSVSKDNVYESGMKNKLTQMGYLVDKVNCRYEQSTKVCEAFNVVSQKTDMKIAKIRVINPDDVYRLAEANKNIKLNFKIEILNMQTKSGEPLLLKSFKDAIQAYGMQETLSPEDNEKFLKMVKNEVSPLNIAFTLKADTTDSGMIHNAELSSKINAGQNIEFFFKAEDVSIDNVKALSNVGDLSRVLKFSKFSLGGKFPNNANDTMENDAKEEIINNFNTQSLVFAELYGLDENITKAISNKLQSLLNENVFKFKLTFINKNRDDLEWVIGSFTKAFLTGQFKLNGDLLKDYKIELE